MYKVKVVTMKKICFIFLVSIFLIGATVFANDIYIDGSGNMEIGTSNTNANFEVTGASAEDAIVGIGSGTGAAGVYGTNTLNNNYGILGYDNYGVFGSSSTGWAGYFEGNARVTGNLTVDGSITGFAETDPVFSAWNKSTGISIIEAQITDLNHFSNADETDPVFSAWDKSTGISISESQVSDIDKYSRSEVDALLASLQAQVDALESQSGAMHWGMYRVVRAGTGSAFDPQVSVSSSGHAVVVWRQHNGSNYDIYANRYIAATGWGVPELLDSGAGNAYDPQVSIDSSGNAIAVWRQYDGSSVVYANRYDVAAGWGTAEVIDAGSGDSLSPQIRVDNSGNAIAVWEYRTGPAAEIYANRYDAATGWGTPEVIDAGTGNAYDPQISIDSSGDVTAVWEQLSGLTSNISANRYAAGSWGTAVSIEAGAGDSYNPQIGSDGSGNAIAVWQQYTGGSLDVYANRYDIATGWDTAEVIGTGAAYTPQVSVDSSGNAIAVWEKYAGSTSDIYANRYDAVSGWGTALMIEAAVGDSYSPQVSVDSNGNAIAVWEQYTGPTDDIYVNRYESGNGWSTAEPLELGTGSAYSPQVGVDGSGNAIAVWVQDSETTSDIYANRFY